jgi:heterodisulfide reductase subunit A
MVNLREQVAWVTEDARAAAAKAERLVDAALRRVALHQPLQGRQIDICPDALVIGAGPAGLFAALCLAAAGRRVALVEKSPVGLRCATRLFPNLSGPCMPEPLLEVPTAKTRRR